MDQRTKQRVLVGVLVAVAWIGITSALPVVGIVGSLAVCAVATVVLVSASGRARLWGAFGRPPPQPAPAGVAVSALLVGLLGISAGTTALGEQRAESAATAQPASAASTRSQPGTSPKPLPAPSAVPAPAKEDATPDVDAEVAALAPLDARAELKILVEGVESGRPVVKGLTNLPNGTELSVSLESKVPGEYLGQAKANVSGQRFNAGPFSADDAPLPAGRYVVSVVMPIPEVQPDAVRAAVGERGERLKGGLVKRGELGITVEQRAEFFVGGTLQSAKAAEAQRSAKRRAEVQAIVRDLRAMFSEGERMDRVRRSEDLSDGRRCGESMRALSPKADALGVRADALPLALKVTVRTAAGYARLCVTCSRDAMSNCKLGRKALAELNTAQP